jgi:alkylhydroperoxidase family enzyme
MARFPYPTFSLATSARPPINVIKLLSHSQSTVDHWAGVGTAHYRSIVLPKRLRELTILYSAAKFESSYEWDHHVIVSEEVVTDAERAAIKSAVGSGESYFTEGRGKGKFAGRELVLLSFLEVVTSGPIVGDALWSEMTANFSEREIVEVLSLQVCLLSAFGRSEIILDDH